MSFARNLFLEQTLCERKWRVTLSKQPRPCTTPSVVSNLCFNFEWSLRLDSLTQWRSFLAVSDTVIDALMLGCSVLAEFIPYSPLSEGRVGARSVMGSFGGEQVQSKCACASKQSHNWTCAYPRPRFSPFLKVNYSEATCSRNKELQAWSRSWSRHNALEKKVLV